MVQRKFDARHEFHLSFENYLRDSLITRLSTIVPIIMNDDALGDPMDFKAHPEHASWAEVPDPNCYPDSEVKSMKVTMDVIVPKALAAITSSLKIQYGLISCAFPEDLDALDEKSGLSMKEVLELQKETTDRQCYPLWSAVDMLSGSTLSAKIPGLTASQVIEGVNFSPEILSDQLRYGRIKGLIKKCMPIGFRTKFVRGRTVAGYSARITFNFVPSNAKFINPYTFLGLLIHVPQTETANQLEGQHDQPILEGDVTADTQKIIFMIHVQYNERNPEFHMGKV